MCIVGAAILCCLQPILAATHYVATDGSDKNPGNEALPFRTIQKAADTAQSGDTVLVRGGQYPEEITLKHSGVAFISVGTDRAVVDGGGTRPHGFHAPGGGNITDTVIEGFEITGQTEKGIYVDSGENDRYVIRDNRIHHIWEKGVYLRGKEHLVEDNVIYMIGDHQESMGILISSGWNTETSGCRVRNNQIYLCKKNGIRDYGGHDNLYENNIIYACHSAFDFNSCKGGIRAFNNYLSKTIYACNPKHVQGKYGWTMFWHNTVYDSALWSVNINGKSRTELESDFVDIRNNIFSKAGDSHIYHEPTTGPNVILDGNLYHRAGDRPEWFYSDEGIPGRRGNRYVNTADLQANTPFEDNGKNFDPLLIDPEHGNLDYLETSPAADGSFALESPYGNQLGARGLVQTEPDFVHLSLTAIAASAHEDRMHYTTDRLQQTHWLSGDGVNRDQWMIYDLGAQVTFGYIVLVPLYHKVQYNIKKFSFEISDDNANYETVLSGSNNDSGSLFIYELDPAVTARYLKLNMIENFPDDGHNWSADQFVFSDLWVGNLVPKP